MRTRTFLRHGALVALMVLMMSSAYECACTSAVYCYGPLLEAIQLSPIFNDSKEFVDMPSRYPSSVILQNFEKIGSNASVAQLRTFINENFYAAGSDVYPITPSDWTPNPNFLSKLKDPNLKEFASFVHGRWVELVRARNRSFCDDCQSHIDVPNPFVIAGSRFREFYYWDSYWIVEGLLVSQMYNTTRDVLRNFLYLVETIGFVPNGGRVYYLNRSQPPLLALMVARYVEETRDFAFLKEALPTLDLEYNFWRTNRVSPVNPNLSIYNVNNSLPRPESFARDVATGFGKTQEQKKNLYAQIATGAETGWDFSSRWLKNGTDLSTIETNNIIPVDLNSFLYADELTLASMHAYFKNSSMEQKYLRYASDREEAIQKMLWNEEVGLWNDFNYVTGQKNVNFYISNMIPAWAGVTKSFNETVLEAIIAAIKPFLAFPAGVPVSKFDTGQQWDFPNGWPNLQWFIIEGLNDLSTNPNANSTLRAEAAEMAMTLVHNWVNTNYCAWKKTNMMFEKYDVTKMGKAGGGGEYVVQDGFGWTNGVVLHLISKYGNSILLDAC